MRGTGEARLSPRSPLAAHPLLASFLLPLPSFASRETLEQIGEVEEFVSSLGLTYNVGLEDATTPTYSAVTENYEGLNPFPTTLVVGKDGIIRLITREYDAQTVEYEIQAALAE